jgi:plastocyanin domain-containing protein
MKTKALPIVVIVLLVAVVITLAIFSSKSANTGGTGTASASSAVSSVNGVQYIDLTARGGYFPSDITAKANTPTVLRVKTANTFDCSSSIVIPSLNYRNNLPSTGTTEITIPPQSANYVLQGTCIMGMYRFNIRFI